MNNKAHLRPKEFDSNGDIIPMACKEEKGDLISREALKKALEPYRYAMCGFEGVLFLIDNAPAVEYTSFEEAFQKTVCEQRLYCPARPQGEWIFMNGVTCGGYYKCNRCGEVERAEKNYCSNCGAIMKNGKLFHVEHTTRGEEQ